MNKNRDEKEIEDNQHEIDYNKFNDFTIPYHKPQEITLMWRKLRSVLNIDKLSHSNRFEYTFISFISD